MQVLEPCDGKLSRTVLRGEWSRKAPDLPGAILLILRKGSIRGQVYF